MSHTASLNYNCINSFDEYRSTDIQQFSTAGNRLPAKNELSVAFGPSEKARRALSCVQASLATERTQQKQDRLQNQVQEDARLVPYHEATSAQSQWFNEAYPHRTTVLDGRWGLDMLASLSSQVLISDIFFATNPNPTCAGRCVPATSTRQTKSACASLFPTTRIKSLSSCTDANRTKLSIVWDK